MPGDAVLPAHLRRKHHFSSHELIDYPLLIVYYYELLATSAQIDQLRLLQTQLDPLPIHPHHDPHPLLHLLHVRH